MVATAVVDRLCDACGFRSKHWLRGHACWDLEAHPYK